MAGSFRYVTPVEPRDATGRTARVYAQLAEDFGLARMALFLTLSPSAEVLAATWALLRESLLAGQASRTGKEVVALGVSMANRCPFCVAAHTTLLHATGDHRLAEGIARGGTPADPGYAALLDWAKAPGGGAGPYPVAHAPEYAGTALAFHFINRMASALLTEDLLPGGLQRSRLVRSLSGRGLARTVRRRLPPGASLPLIEDLPAAAEPPWAAGTPVGAAYAALLAAAGAGGELLGDRARAAVADAVAGWDGEHPAVGAAWLDGPLTDLPPEDRAGARLALLTAFAPYRVTDADVAAWRGSAITGADVSAWDESVITDADMPAWDGSAATDADLVRLCAFGAISATAHLAARITTTAHAPLGDLS
ncbi:carboxymuconolactone decarboxylase family protein [Nonomuraea sp. NPDC050643]|uniref:carboxymuconolactone decarboxylase family protein n=1 Tax=Nonomuraea sp. NPDC050643 TaxID=3155660 RepID=UPI0033C264C6